MLMLRAGESSVVVAPEHGGSIVGWMHGRTPLLRRPAPDAIVSGDVRGFGCFPLVPFCNRIAHGRFAWQGRTYQLDRNFGDHPHAIHGVGWQDAWTVRRVSDSAATLCMVHDATGARAQRWPFAFAAEQHVALTEHGLSITLRITNHHPAPAPAGLGLHPYFPCAGVSELSFRAAGVWINDPSLLPVRHVAVPDDWDHATLRAVGSAALDNCFTDW